MEKRTALFILFFLLVVGLYLRLSGTLRGYFAFTFDQGRDLLVLQDIVYKRSFRLIGPPSGIEGVFHGVWWYWFLAPVFWLFRGNPTSIVSIFNIFSTSAILFAFALGKVLKDYRTGIIAAALVAVSPFFIGTSAQLWNPNVVPILTIVFLIGLFLFFEKKMSSFWLCFMLGAIIEFHIGFGTMFFLALLLMFLLTRPKLHPKEVIKGLAGLGFWLLPRIIFDLRHHFLQTASLLAYLFHPVTIHSNLDIGSRIIDRLLIAFHLTADAFGGGNQYVGLVVLGISAYIGTQIIRGNVYKRRKQFITRIVIVIFALLGIAALYPDALWEYYLVGYPALVLPLVVLTLRWLTEKFHMFGWILVTGLLIYNLAPWNFFKPQWEGDAAVFKNQLAVVAATYKQANGEQFNTSTYSPSLIDYNYQYLYQWYGQKKYGYFPERDKTLPLVFFIVEPDPWNKGLRQIWLREREGDGETLWQENFPGGIIVEERRRL